MMLYLEIRNLDFFDKLYWYCLISICRWYKCIMFIPMMAFWSIQIWSSFFFMALLLGIKLGLRGKKHGHQAPPMEKKIYFGRKSGYLMTWETMSKSYLCHTIPIFLKFMMMWQKLAWTFFKVWWWIQGTTMSTTTLRLHFLRVQIKSYMKYMYT